MQSNYNRSGSRIDSHSSFLNNKRVQMLLMEIDRLALVSGRTMLVGDINAYWDSVEQLYLNVSDPLSNKADIEEVRQSFSSLITLINNDKQYRTRKAIRLMRELAKKFNYLVITGLQQNQYFFRMGIRETKGLKNIKFFGDGIFGKGGKENVNKGKTTERAA